MKNHSIYFICGVSGCGKTTIGSLLAQHLNISFLDGDDFHPKSNVQKMNSGTPLNDQDRQVWLASINQEITNSNQSLVIACSALKEDYRQTLIAHLKMKVNWIFLNGSFELISSRIKARKDHFMPSSLLQSQFDILTIPEYALALDISLEKEKIIYQILNHFDIMKQQFGLIGLGVMGKSLSRNFANKGVRLSLYNRRIEGSEENVASDFIAQNKELSEAAGFEDLSQFVNSLQSPKKIFLMISAGEAVDLTIDSLVPLLNKGDIIIDGGNSHYKLTQNRNEKLEKHGIFFIGTGVSGGEEGALKGPSIMPGGEKAAYALVKDEFDLIAAKDKNDKPCCGYIGKGGAGHFVKMVHNGIEYAEMQLIAEVYHFLRYSNQMRIEEIAKLFDSWLQSELTSYLLEVTVEVLQKKEGDKNLVDIILDKAGNKGTGSWTTISACELGVPIPTLTAALFARYQSSFKEDRTKAENLYSPEIQNSPVDLDDLFNAYKVARIINHHQGLHLIHVASEIHDWQIDLPEVARIWTNGCIIRSAFMEDLTNLLKKEGQILLHSKIIPIVRKALPALRSFVSKSAEAGASIPCFQASLGYIETFIRDQSSANIIQGQRDFFGAHRYQRKDDPTNKTYHTNWS